MPGGVVDPATGRIATTGFRDTSRLAASDPTMMADIMMTNTDALTESLTAIRDELDALLDMSLSGEADALKARLSDIRQARIDWAEEHGFAT